MNEEVFQFGTSNGLTGVLSSPDVIDHTQPVVLILNAGIVHRSGPFRLHVDISRSLARSGFQAFRMDLSGLGDSDVRREIDPGQNRAVLDTTDAIEFLASQTGASKFIVIGLCSGAYNAHLVAINDARIVGAVFMDGLVYPTEEHHRRERMIRLTRPRKWRNAVKRRLMSDVMEQANPDAPDASEFFETDRTADQVTFELQRLLDRDVQLLHLYTEGYAGISSRSQFEEMFGLVPDEEQLQVEYYENFEHTYRLAAHRETIVARIANWCVDRFANSRN